MKKRPITKEIRSQIESEWKEACDFAQIRPLTVFLVRVEFRGKEYSTMGIAQCLATDEWNPQFGYDAARTRAYRQVQREIFTDFFVESAG